MNSNQWRDASHLSIDSNKSINTSDSEDEVPGSRDASDEEASNMSPGLTSRPMRGGGVSQTIIDTTEDEEEDEDDAESNENHNSINRDGEIDESIDSDWMDIIDKDKDKIQTKNDGDSDSDASVANQSKKKLRKRITRKPVIEDEESEIDERDSQDLDSEHDTDDEDFNASAIAGNSSNSVMLDDSPISSKKNKGKKFMLEDESSEEERNEPRTSRPGPKSSKTVYKVDNDSINESYEEVDVDKDLKHSTVVNIDDSSDDQSNNENLPLSISNSSAPEIALSLAREESQVNGINPLLIQQRALDSFKLEQLKKNLLRAKTLYQTANRDQLPDRGEKLRLSIDNLEKDVKKLSSQLERTSMIENIKPGSPIFINNESPGVSPSIKSQIDPTVFIDADKEMGKKAQATFDKQQALTVERIQHLQQSLNRCPEENERAEDPRGLKTKLMPHQQHALAWMLWRENEKPPGGLLADDMGLGKTLTMISLVVATKDESFSDSSDTDDEDERWSNHKKFGRPRGGTLVVCPASLLDQWQNEVNNRCRKRFLTVEIHHGQRREVVPKRLAKNDMVITTYQLVASEYRKNSALFKIRWKRIILDEAHAIRNHTAKISEAVCKLSGRNRWALTGTPVHNKEQDLYALLKFLRVTPFNDLQVWKRWVDNKNSTGLARLATVTKTLMLRRTKQELIAKGNLDELPEKFYTSIPIDLDEEETKLYRLVQACSRTLFAEFLAQRAEKQQMLDVNAGKFNKPFDLVEISDSHFEAARKQLIGCKENDIKAHQILLLILRLRQICCHPGLIKQMLNKEEAEANGILPEEEDEEDDLVSQVNNMTIVENEENEDENRNGDNVLSVKNPIFKIERPSSKVRAVLNTVDDILKTGEKMVIVSQWTSMLEIISTHLSEMEGVMHEIFSGATPIKKRQGIIDRFNDPDDDLVILLLSLTAGGVGLNLVGGNHLLLIDIHWNPQLESQAQDRIYRFGQKRNVHVYRFLCNDTVEEKVKKLQEKKLNLAEDIFTGHRRTSSKLSLDDMKSLFQM